MKNISVKIKFLIAFLLILVLVIISNFVYFNVTKDIHTTMNEFYDHPYQVSNTTKNISINIKTIHALLDTITPDTNQSDLLRIEAEVKGLEESITEDLLIIEKQYLGEKRDVENLIESFQQSVQIHHAIIDAAKIGDFDFIDNHSGESALQLETTNTLIEKISAFADNKAIEFIASSRNKYNTQFLLIIFVSLGTGILITGLLLFFNFTITKPITDIVDEIENATDPDYSVHLDTKRKDEIGVLSNKFVSQRNEINRRHKETIAQLEQEFSELFNNIHLGTVLVLGEFEKSHKIRDFEIISYNSAFNMLFFKPNTSIKSNIRLFKDSMGSQVKNIIRSIAETKASISEEIYDDRQKMYYRVVGFELDKSQMVLMFDDITENRLQQNLLIESEIRNELIANQFEGILWTVDARLKFTAAAGSGLKKLGLKNDDVADKPLDYVFGDSEDLKKAHRAAFSGETVMLELPVGDAIWLLSIKPFIDQSGTNIGAIGFGRDLTERIKSKNNLRRVQLALETSVEAVMIFETEDSILFKNNALDEMLKPAVISGVTKSASQLVSNIFAEEIGAAFEGKTTDKETQIKVGARKKLDIHLRINPVYDLNGKQIGALLYMRNTTARKTAERQITALNKDLEKRIELRTAELLKANQALKSFSYSVSHDLRAPLRHINGYVDMLFEHGGPDLPETCGRYLTIIKDAAMRMNALINGLLEFSRIGRAALKIKTVDFDKIVNEIIARDIQDTKERKIKWRVGTLGKVEADATLIHTVWTNLISNAVKYTGKVERAEIEIGKTEENGKTAYFVKDNGAGFDMKYYEKLFGVFQRLHREEEFSGTGVGLANIKIIIEKHGGEIWAESELGKGATFYFTLNVDISPKKE